MELNGDERAADAIDRAAALAAQRAGTEHSDLIARFTQCYLHDTDVADLEDRAVDDLYGAVLSHWKLGYERRAGAAKVAFVNPDMDTSGWRSPHTVVMIVTDDAPSSWTRPARAQPARARHPPHDPPDDPGRPGRAWPGSRRRRRRWSDRGMDVGRDRPL